MLTTWLVVTTLGTAIGGVPFLIRRDRGGF